MFALSNQKLIPKLHIMNLVAKDERGEAHLFLFSTVAISKQDAFIRGLETMKHLIPGLYELGQANSGFSIASYQVLSYSDIKHNFNLEMQKTEPAAPAPDFKIQFEQVPEEKPVTLSRKSKAMHKIIQKGSLEYLDKKASKYTEFEVEYMRAEIKRSHENA